MEDSVFYVYNKYGLVKICRDSYELGNFVVKVGFWSFGNSFHDKRWSLKIRKFAGGNCCSSYLREIGEEALLPVEYVLYDENYEVVPCKTLDRFYWDAAYRHNIYPISRIRRWRWRTHDNYPGFRNGPVPGTGRVGSYSYFRTPKTTQERRMSIAHFEFTRGRRRTSTLPNAWDDVHRADRWDKYSWKKQKKRKQWM